MIKFFIIVLVLISKFSFSNDFKLVCNEISKSVNKDFSKSFVKIINFVDRTVLNYSGNYFDKVVLFNNREIVLHNKIFQITSTYNIKKRTWTSYKGHFIKIYKCEKRKRRF